MGVLGNFCSYCIICDAVDCSSEVFFISVESCAHWEHVFEMVSLMSGDTCLSFQPCLHGFYTRIAVFLLLLPRVCISAQSNMDPSSFHSPLWGISSPPFVCSAFLIPKCISMSNILWKFKIHPVCQSLQKFMSWYSCVNLSSPTVGTLQTQAKLYL